MSSIVSLNTPRFSTSGTSILHIFEEEEEEEPFLLNSLIKPANTSELVLRTCEFSSKTKHPPPVFPLKFNLTSNTVSSLSEISGGARKLSGFGSGTEESTAVMISSGSSCSSWIMEWTVGSESMGETRPGDKIRRGSIRVRPTRLNPDLVLSGELGMEEFVGFDERVLG